MTKEPCVYILASSKNGTLYIGVTSNLPSRIDQHKSHVVKGFTAKYNISDLVWYETHTTMQEAIAREKQLKRWNRAWKLELIEKDNPSWKDLAEELF